MSRDMAASPAIWAERLLERPIVSPNMDARMGDNINGPSLIRVPSWVQQPLGRYYLYFAHHHGQYIRLAYANHILGPWTMYTPGVLSLAHSGFHDHLASPDVHVDMQRRKIIMYYHGVVRGGHKQMTRVAQSSDGMGFVAIGAELLDWYARIFNYGEWVYALTMPGTLSRSRTGLSHFERGPTLFTPAMRHCAVRVEDDTLQVFYSNRGDNPESILCREIELSGDWMSWRAGPPTLLLSPEKTYEGSGLPRVPSAAGRAAHPVCQLRDPCIFCEDETTYLLYCVAGESGLALARIHVGTNATIA
jgi:hypothetical protein